VPTIAISDKASISPDNSLVQDFTNPVVYTVTAEDTSTETYTVTVTIEPKPIPIPDIIPPTVTSYTFNGNQGNVTVSPTSTNPLSIIINASEPVNWMSIKIERESDHTFYKMFQSGKGCVDGTDTCTKVWDGTLSSGGLIQNGDYRIKLHMKDLSNNEFYDYLSPYVVTVNTTL
jgi:hypothetical protein